jgi:putative tryptophan/tyrosine transport system substrate-binding protein
VKRRQFITLLGGAAVSWPMAARAQQPKMPVIGFLSPLSPDSIRHFVTAFRQGLGETGYAEGRNAAIEFHWAEGRFDRLAELAADLVSRQVNVIATPGSTAAALAAKSATTAIPIVFGIPDDPVKFGLVASLGRPGGNATGVNFFTAELVAKRLGLLRELLPAATHVAVLVNPANPAIADATRRDVQEVARTVGLQINIINASSGREIDAAFAAIATERVDALFVGSDVFFISRRVQLANLAARHAVPTAFAVRDYVEAGGLMSYGTNIPDMFRQVGVYTGRILKGSKPADLPVEQATKFELVLNLQTARMLGLTVPDKLLATADEVIE